MKQPGGATIPTLQVGTMLRVPVKAVERMLDRAGELSTR